MSSFTAIMGMSLNASTTAASVVLKMRLAGKPRNGQDDQQLSRGKRHNSCPSEIIVFPPVPFRWKCRDVNEIVYVQNQLRFYEQPASPFRLDSLYDYVADRKTVRENDGAPISEWQMPFHWIRDFLTRSAVDGH